MTVHSSHGILRIDEAGRPVHVRLDTDDLRSANVLTSIQRFDLGEYLLAHGRREDEYDVLDLGYWHPGGYEPPDHAWRATHRTGVRSDPARHVARADPLPLDHGDPG